MNIFEIDSLPVSMSALFFFSASYCTTPSVEVFCEQLNNSKRLELDRCRFTLQRETTSLAGYHSTSLPSRLTFRSLSQKIF